MVVNAKALAAILSLYIVLLPGLTVRAFTAPAPVEASVFLYPQRIVVKANDTFQASVNVANVSKLQGFDFMVAYDTRLLDCLSLDEGTFMSSFGATFVAKREINDSLNPNTGRVWLAVAILGTGFADGNGTLAVITFTAVGVGESVLDLFSDFPLRPEAVKLTTCGPKAIPNEAFDGLVVVTADSSGSGDPPPDPGSDPANDPPSADVNGDGVVNIQDIAAVAVVYGAVKGASRYNSKVDLDHNGLIDIRDVAIVALHFARRF
jgi:hypothetical protein